MTTETCAQAPKFSRYRSLRKPATPAASDHAPAVPTPDESSVQVNRAPSRYHRVNRQRTQTLPSQPSSEFPAKPAPPNSPPTKTAAVPAVSAAQKPATQSPADRNSISKQQDEYQFAGGPVQSQQSPDASAPKHQRQLSRTASHATRPHTAASPISYEAAREEARMILEGEYDRLQKAKELQKKHERKPDEEAPKPKRRPTQTQHPKPDPVYFDAPKLNVHRKVERVLPEKYHDAPQPVKQRSRSPDHKPKTVNMLEAKGHGPPKQQTVNMASSMPAQRQFDAPVSAVNAGDRRVEVRLGGADHGITLPVTPTTNSKDLLNSASVVMSEDFNPRTSILVESFSKVGLERPLRRYEHIRDVMNSWDADDQNYLIIMTESECQATGLERHEAPEEPPDRTMVQMHLSPRPGKWEKKWVILRSDGQVTMSKYENDGEATNICHLSDFDVYTPTSKQRKKLKLPKKICFAVKSQQKSAMFLEGVNFVHFFATGDKQAADRWYNAVQTWRSWYLVHVLGEGAQKGREQAAVGIAQGTAPARPMTAQSSDSVPYQLGSFQPLLDFSDLDFNGDLNANSAEADPVGHGASKKPSLDLGLGLIGRGTETATNGHLRHGSRQKGVPPSSFPAKLISDVENRGRTSLDNSDQAFTGRGLLGRSVSRRSQSGKPSGQAAVGVAGKPLVDLTPASEFAEGSLLQKLEAWSATQGENELKIDRQRRVEADIRVGEGY